MTSPPRVTPLIAIVMTLADPVLAELLGASCESAGDAADRAAREAIA